MPTTILNRILLLNILPAAGDVTTVRIVRNLREDLSFSEQEHTDFQLVQSDGKITWNSDATTTKDIEIGPKARGVITKALKDLSDSQKLTPQYLDLYEQFVGE